MVSRRKILSRSRDDLNLDQTFSPQEEEEDVWYQKDKLYKEHIQEVLDKWTQIDDEIWAKVIVFERNRRVAKAYARAPVLTINGSDDGFDGMRIGLCGFDNPMRDQKTEEFKKHIGQGVKIKMDDAGNILIRRYAKSNVYIKSTANSQNEETSIGADILKLPNQALESEKIVKLFDMKKFQSNVNRELRRAYPDRRRLETQCLSAVAFVKSESDILECPIWVLIVNVVAMDMLKSKLPPVQRPLVDIKNRPRIPIPDEDPYSVAGNGSGGSSGSSGFGASAMGSMMSAHNVQQQLQQHQQLQQQSQSMTNNNSNNNNSGNGSNNGGGVGGCGGNTNLHLNNGNVMGAGINGNGHIAATREQLLMQTQQLSHKRSEKPPKLPPRDNIYGQHDIPKPDYDDIEVDTRIKLSRGKSDKGKDNKKYDDPYYCGLRARVPNFVKTSSSKAGNKEHHAAHANGVTAQNAMNTLTNQKKTSIMMPMHPAMHAPAPPHMHPHHIQQQQMMAVAAAHAVAQQQQQQQHQHHPMHHHAHAHAQQMWQTRSFESGIGIYNHNTTATATTTTTPLNAALTAATATATTFISTETQQQQQQPQQQTFALSMQTNGNPTTPTATTTAGIHYPSAGTTSTSTLYNYIAPYSNEHHHHNLQSLTNTMPITAAAATAAGVGAGEVSPSSATSFTTASVSNANGCNNLLQPHSLTLGLNTNMTNYGTSFHYQQPPAPNNTKTTITNTNPLQTDLNNENLYGQTRNVNFKQVHQHQHQYQQQQQPQLQQHLQHSSSSNHSGNGNGYGNYHNHHHSRHHQHQRSHQQSHPHHHSSHHHRRNYGSSSHMCLRHPQTPARSSPGEFYYKAHDLYSNRDELEMERSRSRLPQARPSRRSSSTTNTALDSNCNCVSCYALAPLFGAPTPKRPPRSLSQQQLRQHQLLSGAKERSHVAQGRGVMKWCSDSDVSLLGRDDRSASEETDEYRTYMNRQSNYGYASAFDFNNDFDMDDLTASHIDYKKQLENPKKSQKFNGYAARHKYRHPSPQKEQHPLTDGYVDKARLRQLRSPRLQRKASIQINEVKSDKKEKDSDTKTTNLLHMRSKSQSTESFFEQPAEEGSLYIYGGRKRIVKAPSTTNIYDRVKSHQGDQTLKAGKKYNSQLNLSKAAEYNGQHLSERNSDKDTLKPLVPPPLWRGAKRMNLKSLIGAKPNNAIKQQYDINNNLVTKTDTILNNFKHKKDLTHGSNNQKQNDAANGKDKDKGPYDNGHNQSAQQQTPSMATSGRVSRSTSRVDISDLESIYGYLKPRKPRSLSVKKIQILDY